MTKLILNYSILFVVLILLQVLICNNISIFNIATPFIFIYCIISLPVNTRLNWVLTLSFLTGLIVDIFSDTQGMNSLACTILGVLKMPIFKLYVPRHDEISDTIPSIKNLGIGVFLKFILTMTLLYCTMIVAIEAFTTQNLLISLIRIASSTVLSVAIIIGIDSIAHHSNEKKL